MKYIDFEKDVADFENGRYEARLDRAKRNVEDYMHKNHVHVFDKKKKKMRNTKQKLRQMSEFFIRWKTENSFISTRIPSCFVMTGKYL